MRARPMKTAPRDGTKILAWIMADEKFEHPNIIHFYYGAWFDSIGCYREESIFRCWLPIPKVRI